MNKFTIFVHDLAPDDMFNVGGHVAKVTDVKRIGDWSSITFKIDHAISESTLILTNNLTIEVLEKK